MDEGWTFDWGDFLAAHFRSWSDSGRTIETGGRIGETKKDCSKLITSQWLRRLRQNQKVRVDPEKLINNKITTIDNQK